MYASVLVAALSFAAAVAGPARRNIVPSSLHIKPHDRLRFSGLTVFGDSFCDDGLAPGGAWRISNHTTPSNPFYFNNHTRRYSNGPVWVEDLAAGLGIPLTDYAVGGATSDDNLIPGEIATGLLAPGTIQQLATWKSHVGGKAKPDELYVLLIGANDGINADVNDITPGSTQIPLTLLAEGVVERYQWIVGNLTAAGAQNFLLGIYPDLSDTPLVREEAAAPSFGTNLKTYNDALRSGILALASSLKSNFKAAAKKSHKPEVQVTVTDMYTLMNTVLEDPKAYGYKVTNVGCVVGTYPDSTLCSFDPKVQNTYLFWDHVHPTARSHEYIAAYSFEQLINTYA